MSRRFMSLLRRSAALHRAALLMGLLALALRPAYAQQVTVAASVDETTVGAQETVRYTIEIRGAPPSDVQTPNPPQTDGLAIVQPNPMTSQSVSYVNGQVSQSVAFQWRFRPIQEGQAEIGKASVVVGGRAYSTEAIALSIIPQAQRPQQPRTRSLDDLLRDDDPAVAERELGERDLFIQVRPSARTVYQNEQMYIEYDLFFRDGIQLRNNRLADSWHAEGFWREDLDLDDRPNVRDEVVNGLRYKAVTLKRVAVFPTRTGELRIDPLRIESEIALPSRTRSMFSQFFGSARFQQAMISSPPLTIASKPLPDGAPPSFSGAVGQFDLDVEVDRTEVEAGEPIKLSIRIAGTGNVATLAPPTFELPPLIEQYQPEVTDMLDRKRRRVSGSKTFTYVLVPRSSGEHTIPGMEMAYFDPTTERYERMTSPPIPLSVVGGTVAPAPSRVTSLGLPLDDIAGPMMAGATAWRSLNQQPLYRSPWPYVVIVLPLLILGSLYGVRRRQTKLSSNAHYARSRRAHPVARKHLKKAESLLASNQPKAFYEEIARAMLGFVGNRLNVSPHGLTLPQLDALLAEQGVREPTRTDFRTLVRESDQARYAPTPPGRDTMETATERAAHVIADLSDTLPQARSNG